MRRDKDDDAIDLDDEDESPGPDLRSRVGAVRSIRLAAWIGLFCVTALIGLSFYASVSRANSAIQEAGAGAVFGGAAVVCYILTRCVDEVLAKVEQSWRDDNTTPEDKA